MEGGDTDTTRHRLRTSDPRQVRSKSLTLGTRRSRWPASPRPSLRANLAHSRSSKKNTLRKRPIGTPSRPHRGHARRAPTSRAGSPLDNSAPCVRVAAHVPCPRPPHPPHDRSAVADEVCVDFGARGMLSRERFQRRRERGAAKAKAGVSLTRRRAWRAARPFPPRPPRASPRSGPLPPRAARRSAGAGGRRGRARWIR